MATSSPSCNSISCVSDITTKQREQVIDPGDVAIETDELEVKLVSITSTTLDNSDLLVVTIDPF